MESEIAKYAVELSERAGITETQFNEAIEDLFRAAQLQIVPKKVYESHLKKAAVIVPDPKDILYFALALKFECPL